MCGIAGFSGLANMRLLQDMAAVINHRGPDSNGFFSSPEMNFAHVRLSIIDLQEGQQPIYNEDKSVVVVYNGEIYNYQSLREQLSAKGHVFRTKTDTEILVHLYEDHSMEFLNKLSGIFSFALWDIHKKKLFLVRDQLGVKPLHYFFNGKQLVFGSEVKAMLLHPEITASLDYSSLHSMLNWRFVMGEKTLFKGINKVMPGCYLTYDRNTITNTKYWTLNRNPDYTKPKSYFIDMLRERFISAVQKNMVSDVPVGAFLSGGIDSTAIVGVMSRYTNSEVHTFTLGFDTPEDECEAARRTAALFKTQHHEHTVAANPMRHMTSTIWHSETPKINIIQQYLISQYAASNVKAVLSGVGGDELFAGQVNYDYIAWCRQLHNLCRGRPQRYVMNVLSKLLFSVQNAVGGPATDEYRRGLQMLLSYGDRNRYYAILRNVWDFDAGMYSRIYADPKKMIEYNAHQVTEPFFMDSSQDFLHQALLSEVNMKLVEDGLHIEDRMSMAWSLESRVPFLDKDLVEFSMQIPPEYKIYRGDKKNIFKEALKDLLPAHVLQRPKQGFGFNTYVQMKRDLKKTAEKILSRERIINQGIFNYEYIHAIINYPPTKQMRWHYFYLWNLIGFQIWYDMFLRRNPHDPVEFNLDAYI